MLANGQVGWNMTAADPLFHLVSVTTWQYNAGVAKELIAYKDKESDDDEELANCNNIIHWYVGPSSQKH